MEASGGWEVDFDSFIVLLGLAGISGLVVLDETDPRAAEARGSLSVVPGWDAAVGAHVVAAVVWYSSGTEEDGPTDWIWTVAATERPTRPIRPADMNTLSWLWLQVENELRLRADLGSEAEAAATSQGVSLAFESRHVEVSGARWSLRHVEVADWVGWAAHAPAEQLGVYGVRRGRELPALRMLPTDGWRRWGRGGRRQPQS